MKEELKDQLVDYLTNSLTEAERHEFLTKVQDIDTETKKEMSDLYSSFHAIALDVEIKKAPISIKENLFKQINTLKDDNVIDISSKKSAVNYWLVAASVLITFFATRYYYATIPLNQSPNNTNPVSVVHTSQNEMLNTALCLIAQGTNMSQKDKAGEMHYGKIYYNKFAKSSVIHICYLPKQQQDQNYTLWLKTDQGFEKLHIFEADQPIQELNYLVDKEFVDAEHKLLITLEDGLKRDLPSNDVMLANL